LTSLIDPQVHDTTRASNTIVYEGDARIRAEIFKAFSTTTAHFRRRCPAPPALLSAGFRRAGASYDQVFRVIIMQFPTSQPGSAQRAARPACTSPIGWQTGDPPSKPPTTCSIATIWSSACSAPLRAARSRRPLPAGGEEGAD